MNFFFFFFFFSFFVFIFQYFHEPLGLDVSKRRQTHLNLCLFMYFTYIVFLLLFMQFCISRSTQNEGTVTGEEFFKNILWTNNFLLTLIFFTHISRSLVNIRKFYFFFVVFLQQELLIKRPLSLFEHLCTLLVCLSNRKTTINLYEGSYIKDLKQIESL